MKRYFILVVLFFIITSNISCFDSNSKGENILPPDPVTNEGQEFGNDLGTYTASNGESHPVEEDNGFSIFPDEPKNTKIYLTFRSKLVENPELLKGDDLEQAKKSGEIKDIYGRIEKVYVMDNNDEWIDLNVRSDFFKITQSSETEDLKLEAGKISKGQYSKIKIVLDSSLYDNNFVPCLNMSNTEIILNKIFILDNKENVKIKLLYNPLKWISSIFENLKNYNEEKTYTGSNGEIITISDEPGFIDAEPDFEVSAVRHVNDFDATKDAVLSYNSGEVVMNIKADSLKEGKRFEVERSEIDKQNKDFIAQYKFSPEGIFKKPIEVTVKIPVDSAGKISENGNNINVLFYNESKNIWLDAPIKEVTKDGKVTFVTDHFSSYAIALNPYSFTHPEGKAVQINYNLINYYLNKIFSLKEYKVVVDEYYDSFQEHPDKYNYYGGTYVEVKGNKIKIGDIKVHENPNTYITVKVKETNTVYKLKAQTHLEYLPNYANLNNFSFNLNKEDENTISINVKLKKGFSIGTAGVRYKTTYEGMVSGKCANSIKLENEMKEACKDAKKCKELIDIDAIDFIKHPYRTLKELCEIITEKCGDKFQKCAEKTTEVERCNIVENVFERYYNTIIKNDVYFNLNTYNATFYYTLSSDSNGILNFTYLPEKSNTDFSLSNQSFTVSEQCDFDGLDNMPDSQKKEFLKKCLENTITKELNEYQINNKFQTNINETFKTAFSNYKLGTIIGDYLQSAFSNIKTDGKPIKLNDAGFYFTAPVNFKINNLKDMCATNCTKTVNIPQIQPVTISGLDLKGSNSVLVGMSVNAIEKFFVDLENLGYFCFNVPGIMSAAPTGPGKIVYSGMNRLKVKVPTEFEYTTVTGPVKKNAEMFYIFRLKDDKYRANYELQLYRIETDSTDPDILNSKEVINNYVKNNPDDYKYNFESFPTSIANLNLNDTMLQNSTIDYRDDYIVSDNVLGGISRNYNGNIGEWIWMDHNSMKSYDATTLSGKITSGGYINREKVLPDISSYAGKTISVIGQYVWDIYPWNANPNSSNFNDYHFQMDDILTDLFYIDQNANLINKSNYALQLAEQIPNSFKATKYLLPIKFFNETSKDLVQIYLDSNNKYRLRFYKGESTGCQQYDMSLDSIIAGEEYIWDIKVIDGVNGYNDKLRINRVNYRIVVDGAKNTVNLVEDKNNSYLMVENGNFDNPFYWTDPYEEGTRHQIRDFCEYHPLGILGYVYKNKKENCEPLYRYESKPFVKKDISTYGNTSDFYWYGDAINSFDKEWNLHEPLFVFTIGVNDIFYDDYPTYNAECVGIVGYFIGKMYTDSNDRKSIYNDIIGGYNSGMTEHDNLSLFHDYPFRSIETEFALFYTEKPDTSPLYGYNTNVYFEAFKSNSYERMGLNLKMCRESISYGEDKYISPIESIYFYEDIFDGGICLDIDTKDYKRISIFSIEEHEIGGDYILKYRLMPIKSNFFPNSLFFDKWEEITYSIGQNYRIKLVCVREGNSVDPRYTTEEYKENITLTPSCMYSFQSRPILYPFETKFHIQPGKYVSMAVQFEFDPYFSGALDSITLQQLSK